MGSNCCTNRKSELEKREKLESKNLVFTREDCVIEKYNNLFLRGTEILIGIDSLKKQYLSEVQTLRKIGKIRSRDYDLIIKGTVCFIWAVAAEYFKEGSPGAFFCEFADNCPHLTISMTVVKPQEHKEYFEFHEHLEKLIEIIHTNREIFAQEKRKYEEFLIQAQEETKNVRQDTIQAGMDPAETERVLENIEINIRRFKARKVFIDEYYYILEKEYQRYHTNLEVLRYAVRIAFERAKIVVTLKTAPKTLHDFIELYQNDPIFQAPGSKGRKISHNQKKL